MREHINITSETQSKAYCTENSTERFGVEVLEIGHCTRVVPALELMAVSSSRQNTSAEPARLAAMPLPHTGAFRGAGKT